MTAVRKPFHEPEENETRIALLLDGLVQSLDDALGQAVKHGLEAQARAVFVKHIPALALPPPSPAANPDALLWSKLTTLLRRFATYRLTAAEHATLAEVRAFVQAEMRRGGADVTEGEIR